MSLLVAVADAAELAAEAIKDPAERLFAEAEECLYIFICIYTYTYIDIYISYTHTHMYIDR